MGDKSQMGVQLPQRFSMEEYSQFLTAFIAIPSNYFISCTCLPSVCVYHDVFPVLLCPCAIVLRKADNVKECTNYEFPPFSLRVSSPH